jgi:hypothetical protein
MLHVHNDHLGMAYQKQAPTTVIKLFGVADERALTKYCFVQAQDEVYA